MLVLIPVNLSDCFAAYSRYACSLRLLYCNTASKPTLESCGYANPTRYVHFYFEENA